MHDLNIRAVRAGDAAAVALLAEELGYPATAEEIARRLELLSSSSDDAIFTAVLGLTPSRGSTSPSSRSSSRRATPRSAASS